MLEFHGFHGFLSEFSAWSHELKFLLLEKLKFWGKIEKKIHVLHTVLMDNFAVHHRQLGMWDSKFGRAARWLRVWLPVIRLSVLVLGSGHFSLSASFAFSILSTSQLVSSMISNTTALSVSQR